MDPDDLMYALYALQLDLYTLTLLELLCEPKFEPFNTELLTTIELESECNICMDIKNKFKELQCCNNKIYQGTIRKIFKK